MRCGIVQQYSHFARSSAYQHGVDENQGLLMKQHCFAQPHAADGKHAGIIAIAVHCLFLRVGFVDLAQSIQKK